MRLNLYVAEFLKWVSFFSNYEHEMGTFCVCFSNLGKFIGIRCEIANCDWVDGRPKLGHLQEAAREMRFTFLYVH